MDLHQCFHLWLYLVASFLLSKHVNFFSGGKVKAEENDSTIADDAVSYSESIGSPHSTCSPTYFDAFSEILDFDNRTSYMLSLLSLEDEDSEWLSDSMTFESPSSPLSYVCDSFTGFSDVDLPSYWDSLLKLEEGDKECNLNKENYMLSLLNLEDEDSEWLSDSMTFKSPYSSLSYRCDSFTGFSDVDLSSYWDSLLKLEEEDNEWNLNKENFMLSLLNLEDENFEWLSDSMTFKSPSSPLSYNDSFTGFSDVDLPNYWGSLLKLDKEDNDSYYS